MIVLDKLNYYNKTQKRALMNLFIWRTSKNIGSHQTDQTPNNRSIKRLYGKRKPALRESGQELDHNKQLEEYRSHLIAADQKAQDDYDKNLLALSGGALGISFAFVKDFISGKCIILPILLFLSWVFWGSSIICVLLSYFFSMKALRKTIYQVDNNQVYTSNAGGRYSQITLVLNFLSGLFFIAGVLLLAFFVLQNLR